MLCVYIDEALVHRVRSSSRLGLRASAVELLFLFGLSDVKDTEHLYAGSARPLLGLTVERVHLMRTTVSVEVFSSSSRRTFVVVFAWLSNFIPANTLTSSILFSNPGRVLLRFWPYCMQPQLRAQHVSVEYGDCQESCCDLVQAPWSQSGVLLWTDQGRPQLPKSLTEVISQSTAATISDPSSYGMISTPCDLNIALSCGVTTYTAQNPKLAPGNEAVAQQACVQPCLAPRWP